MTARPPFDSNASQPPPAEGKLRQFSTVRRALGPCTEFAFLPVEVSDMSDGLALADWLENEGLRVRRVSLNSSEGWHGVLSVLLDSSAAPFDVCLVSADIGPAFDEALQALNTQRDAIAAGLRRPLLWCGKRSFLCRTWEQAPELWARAKLLYPLTLRPPPSVMQALRADDEQDGPLLAHLFDLLDSARKYGAVNKAVNVSIRIMREYVNQGRGLEAHNFALSFLQWLDESAWTYREIAELVGQHRPTIERAVRELLSHESGIPAPSLEPYGRMSHPLPSQPVVERLEPNESVQSSSKRSTLAPTTIEEHPSCSSCGGSRRCLTCNGSGLWYAGSYDEDECSSCGGSGRCPDC